jgi:protein arginine kinase
MTLDELLLDVQGGWLEGGGPEPEFAVSSRIRLARNVEGVPFPHALDRAGAERVLAMAQDAAQELERFGHFGAMQLFPLRDVSALDRQVLVERHLISPQHARGRGGAVILSRDGRLSIMVNEEDHLRIQCLYAGLQLDEAWTTADRIDDLVEEKIRYAFHERFGYLTACPTNAGTGLRASVMMHLPALVSTGKAGSVVAAMNKVGVNVRGFYGEGTEAAGNMFQISNQVALGQSEAEVIGNLKAMSGQIIDYEREARQGLLRDARPAVEDRVFRAFGILGNARALPSEEAMRLLSDVRLGVDLGILGGVRRQALNRLLVVIRPAVLQKLSGEELSSAERDQRRAALVREAVHGGGAGE